MQRKTIKKVLENEEVLDIAKTAEAILQTQKSKSHKNKVLSRLKSVTAYKEFRERMQEAEDLRQKVIKALNKNKK